MRRRRTMQIVKTSIRTKTVTVVDNANLTTGAGTSFVVTGDDLNVGEYGYGIILIKAGNETGTATLDVKYQVKDSNGNYYDHTSATQIVAAGSAIKTIANLDGEIGRIVVTLGDGAGEGYDGVTVEFVMKSR
jgi:hypothetical protein